MRQLPTLLLSFGALILLSSPVELRAQSPPGAANADGSIADRRIALAERAFQRTQDLVAAGALPRIRLEEAQMDLDDARDEAVIERTLYAPPSEQASVASCNDVVAAAERRVDRQQKRLDRAQVVISAGVAGTLSLLPLQQELTLRQTTLDLARTHARLAEEAEAMKSAPPVVAPVPEPAIDDSELYAEGMEHYEGDGVFNEAVDLAPIEAAFASRFDHALPISADGETEVHRELGFDHRGRVDVALDPSQPEGIWLRQYLQLHKIPYYAFTHAIPGKATAAHIHIGPGSARLSSTHFSRTHLSTLRRDARGRSAD